VSDLPPAEALPVLVERGALTSTELRLLEEAAAGGLAIFGVGRAQAASLLARWRGPQRGRKLTPLPHWGTPAAEGVPYDAAARADYVDPDPFAGREGEPR
jgi:hypothetical protein